MDNENSGKALGESERDNLENSLEGSEFLIVANSGKVQEDSYSMEIPVAVKLENAVSSQEQEEEDSDEDHHTGPGFIQPHPYSETNNATIIVESCQNVEGGNPILGLVVSGNANISMNGDDEQTGLNDNDNVQVELDPALGLVSIIAKTYCANCKSPRDSFSKKFNELLPLEYFNPNTGDYNEIEIVEALCEVFKIRWTCMNFTQLCQHENLELCNECSNILVQLYKFYTQFAALTVKSKSFLSTVVSFHKDLNNVEDTDTNRNEHDSDSDHFAETQYATTDGNDEEYPNIQEKKHCIATTDETAEDDEPKGSNIPLKKRVRSKPMKKYSKKQGSKRLSQILKRLTPTSTLKKPANKPNIVNDTLSCKECDKDFKFPIQLRIHLNSPAHKDRLKEIQAEAESGSESDPLEKDIKVEKTFKDKKVAAKRGRKKKIASPTKDLKAKKRSNERKKNKCCSVCNKPFARTKDLKRHMNTHEKKKKKGNLSIECERCGKKFDTEGGLKIHFAAHVRDDNKHICKDCGKKFRKLEALEHHEKVDHGGFKPHECPHCGKCFRLKDKLKLHVMSIHEKRNPFPCQKCEKAFRTKYHLKIHDVAVHVQGGDSVLGCSQCKRKFTDREALEQHVIIHQQEKPFICDKCNKGFQTSARLKLHEKSHLEVPTCLCPICGRAYKHIRDLKLHEVSHQDESTFRFGCGDCGKKFYRIDLLRVHQSNEKHFSPDVVGPSPALRDKALGTRESTFYDLPNTYTNYGDNDDDDEFESGDDNAIIQTPKAKKRRVTKPRQRKIPMSASGENIIHTSLQSHSNVPVIYYQSSMATHFDDHQGPSRETTTTFIPRSESNVTFNFNARDTTRPTLLHSHANSQQQTTITHSHPNTNPAHNQLQIPLVSAHSHNQFSNISNYVIREIGNDRGNLVQGAEQIGFDVISSFINNLG